VPVVGRGIPVDDVFRRRIGLPHPIIGARTIVSTVILMSGPSGSLFIASRELASRAWTQRVGRAVRTHAAHDGARSKQQQPR
jgi:hypothetical protein